MAWLLSQSIHCWMLVLESNRQLGPTFGVLALDIAVPPAAVNLTDEAKPAGAMELWGLAQSRSTVQALENLSMGIGDCLRDAVDRNREPLRGELRETAR